MISKLVDILFRICILYFFYIGWKKGFIKSLFGPIAFFLSFFIAFVYFNITQNIHTSLIICLIFPWFFYAGFILTLSVWQQSLKRHDKLSYSSQLLGGLFSAVWRSTYLATLLIFFTLVPNKSETLRFFQTNIQKTSTFQFYSQWINLDMSDLEKIVETFQDVETLKGLRDTEEFLAVFKHEKMQALFTDEELLRSVGEQNFTKLLTNPKLHAILKDQDLLRKIIALNQKIIESKDGKDK